MTQRLVEANPDLSIFLHPDAPMSFRIDVSMLNWSTGRQYNAVVTAKYNGETRLFSLSHEAKDPRDFSSGAFAPMDISRVQAELSGAMMDLPIGQDDGVEGRQTIRELG